MKRFREIVRVGWYNWPLTLALTVFLALAVPSVGSVVLAQDEPVVVETYDSAIEPALIEPAVGDVGETEAAPASSEQIVAVGAEGETWTFPTGNVAERLAGIVTSLIEPILWGLLTFAAAKLPFPLRMAADWFLTNRRSSLIDQVEQLARRAIGAGMAAVPGANPDKPLSIRTGIAVLDTAVAYFLQKGAGEVIDFINDGTAQSLADQVRQMIAARLSFEPEVDGRSLRVAAPTLKKRE